MKRTPLTRTAWLRRTQFPARSSVRLRLRKPTRPKVTSEERRARKLVELRAEGICEIQVSTTVCTGSATDWSHRIREGQGGPWSPANGMHACRSCHEWIHSHPAAARIKGWALASYDSVDAPVWRRGQWVALTYDGWFYPIDDLSTVDSAELLVGGDRG